MPASRRRRRPSPAWQGRRRIIVATFPGRGVYVRHVGHPEGVDGVHRRAVPSVADGTGHWFGPRWLARSLDQVDVVHLHGLPPQLSPDEVAATAETVRGSGTPLVVTAYHLSDPAGRGGGAFAAQLDALVPRADAVVTLTDTAAAEMRRRWDVDALVLPHPHAVDFVRMRQPRHPVQAGEFVLGTHLAGLNLPSDPVRLVTALIQAIRGLPQGSPRIRLVVHLHDTVLDPGASTYRPAQVHRIDELVRACGGLLRLHRPFTETQLWDHLFSLDLSLVPALHGSHSVWPEACADLGTHVLLPAGTHAAAQRPCLVYDDADVDATSESLRAALGAALERDGARRADPQERWKERVTVAESLRGLYERLLGEPE